MKQMKMLGLLAVMGMALAAFSGATPASAAKFTAGKVGATLTEETLVKHVWTITGSNTECTTIGFAGATEGLETESQKVTPSLSGCTAFGFAMTATNSGCRYVFHAGGTMDIAPTPPATSCEITFVVSNAFAKCKVIWRNQEIPAALSYSNSGTGHITINFNLQKIDAEVTESSGLCPLTKGTHKDAATYTGKSTFKATGTTLGWDA